MDFKFIDIKAFDIAGNELNLNTEITENAGIFDFKITNSGDTDISIYEIKLFEDPLPYDINTKVYGEGFQIGAQYSGTLGEIKCLTEFSDSAHFKMPSENGFISLYNYILIEENNNFLLIGATSCNAYRTEFRLKNTTLKIVQCLEGKTLISKETIILEKIAVLKGDDKAALMKSYSKLINKNHFKRETKEHFLGWSPLHCYGNDITFDELTLNMDFAKKYIPDLNLIIIESGYQPFMGDWLIPMKPPNKNAEVIGIDAVIKEILKKGFVAGLWIAPFIASARSDLFINHPDYFIKDELDLPLSSGQFSYGGWMDTPWYVLDMTNPKTLEYIKKVFTIIYKEWGVRYFKLDALMWGTMPYGVRFDKNKTSIEAYREGLKAILECLGDDCYIDGGNAPIFPSLGLFNSLKMVTDNDRYINNHKAVKEQLINRLWQNNSLWSINPDNLFLLSRRKNFLAKGKLHFKKDYRLPTYKYFAATMRASGGNIILGDKIYALSDYDIDIINNLDKSPKGVAYFIDNSLAVIEYDKISEYLIFNEDFKILKNSIKLQNKAKITDMFNSKVSESDTLEFKVMPKSAAWYKVEY